MHQYNLTSNLKNSRTGKLSPVELVLLLALVAQKAAMMAPRISFLAPELDYTPHPPPRGEVSIKLDFQHKLPKEIVL